MAEPLHHGLRDEPEEELAPGEHLIASLGGEEPLSEPLVLELLLELLMFLILGFASDVAKGGGAGPRAGA